MEEYPIRLRWIWLTIVLSWPLIFLAVNFLNLDPEIGACLFFASMGLGCMYMVFAKRDN